MMLVENLQTGQKWVLNHQEKSKINPATPHFNGSRCIGGRLPIHFNQQAQPVWLLRFHF